MIEKLHKFWKLIAVALLLVFAITSFGWLSKVAADPKNYSDTIATLEEQKQDALLLEVAVTATAATLSMLPDDTASPIADELTDLSTPLFIIVAVLYMEKFLLTTFGWISFRILLPAACILTIIHLGLNKPNLWSWAKKITILALALILVIPFGAEITTLIENTYAESIEQTFGAARNITTETIDVEEEDGEGNWFTNLFDDMVDNVTGLIDMAKQVLSTMVDAVVVLMVTSCVIPMLTLLAFMWIIKLTFRADVPIDKLIEKLPKPQKHQGKQPPQLP